MLDTAHAALQAPIDRPRGIGVSDVIKVGGLGFLNGGTNLLARELNRINAVGGRSDPATEHELEMGAPRRISSRAALRTSSTPSQMTPGLGQQ